MNTPMNQTQLNGLQSEVQAEYQAIQQKIAELAGKQAELQQILYRNSVHRELLAERPVPSYASWLPFSK